MNFLTHTELKEKLASDAKQQLSTYYQLSLAYDAGYKTYLKDLDRYEKILLRIQSIITERQLSDKEISKLTAREINLYNGETDDIVEQYKKENNFTCEDPHLRNYFSDNIFEDVVEAKEVIYLYKLITENLSTNFEYKAKHETCSHIQTVSLLFQKLGYHVSLHEENDLYHIKIKLF
jgi:hypothetical protein